MADSKHVENLVHSSRVAVEGEDLVVVENLKKHFPIQTGLIASIVNRGRIPCVKTCRWSPAPSR